MMKITYTNKEIIIDGEGDFLLGSLTCNGNRTFLVKNCHWGQPMEDKKFIMTCVSDWWDKKWGQKCK